MPVPRILVCEDALGYRMLMRSWLEEAGMEVVGEATSWAEAEQRTAELRPDGVVADLWMPTLDADALQRVRAALPDGVLVSLSGLSADEARRLVGDMNVVDLFLSKRQPPADIVAAVGEIVRRRLNGR